MKKLLPLLLAITLLVSCFASCSDPEPEIDGNVNIVVEANHDAVSAKILKGEIEIAVLPEPKATATILTAKQNGQNYSIKLNLSAEWDKVSDNSLSMGCIIVKNDFLKAHEGAFVSFMNEAKASIEYIGNSANKSSAAQMIVDAGILPKLPIANSALNNLYGSIVYQDGEEMKNTLVSFYDAIELSKPANDFYYIPNTSAASDNTKIRIGVMNGPTGMGLAKMIHDYGKDSDKYEFVAFSSTEAASAALTNNDIDVACVPTNLAAELAAQKNDYVSAAAINCLGSLYVVVKDGVEINSIADLKDKTVYYGDKTSTTEPILKYILSKNKLGANVSE